MANSLIDFGIVQPEAPGSFLRGFQGAQALAQQQAAQQQQNALAALQLRAAQRGEEQALAEQEAYKGAANLGEVQQRLMQAGLGKQSIALQKQMQEQRAAQIKQATDAHDFVQKQLSGVIATPTRQAAEAAIARAEAMGADVSQERERLKNTPDSDIAKWAFIESGNARQALEQSIIQLPGGGTAVEPKYAIPGAQTAAMAAPAAMPAVAAPMAAPAMPAGIPGQTMPTRAAGVNALALPAPGAGPMAQGAVPTPTGGRYYAPAMTPQQQAAEARAQRQLQLQEQAATPEFEQRMAAAKTTGAEQAKSAVAKQQLVRQIDLTIPELENATKKGGLIDQSTGSGIGRMADVAAGFVGQATPGAIATARLAPIADMALKMVPRFEGPQSDKDTQSYKEAAGQLANSNLPTEIRRQAGLEVLRLMKARKNQFVTGDMATIGAPVQPSAPSGAGPSVSNW